MRRLGVALAVAALLVGALPADASSGAGGASAAKKKSKRCHIRKRGHRRVRVCRHKPKRPVSPGGSGTVPVLPAAPGGGEGDGSGSAPAGGGSGGTGAGGAPSSGGSGTGDTGGGPPLLPRRVGVDEREYSVVPSYTTVAAGDVEFDPVNHGEDAHDFSIRNSGGQIISVALESGEATVVNVNLAAGDYTLYCSLAGHEGLGMSAPLTVQ